MKTGNLAAGVTTLFLASLTLACDQPQPTAPVAGREIGSAAPLDAAAKKKLSLALCAPSRGGFTLQSTNPYFPIDVGRQLVLEGEEDGESVRMHLTVLNLTRIIAGVTTRVVEEREWRDDELAEVTWNYHVEASDGTNCYYGEDVDIYEEGGISHEGAWCAATPGNQAGIFMPADPRPGTKYQNEVAPGVALDEAKIVGVGAVEVPFGEFSETIRIREFNPLEGSKDYKVHAAGTGIIVDGILELVDVNQTSGTPEQPVLTEQSCGS